MPFLKPVPAVHALSLVARFASYPRLLMFCLVWPALNLSYGQAAERPENSPAPWVPASPEVYRDFALRHPGDPQHGAELFLNDSRLSCAKCHSIDGSSGRAGPDLFAIGDKFPRPELVRSVLEPSSTIAVGYGTTIVETQDGESVEGVVKQVTKEWIELMGGDGKISRVPASTILEQRTSQVSLMPEGLQTGVSLDEFADLMAFLESRRQTVNVQDQHPGAPETIPLAAQALACKPFLDARTRFAHPVWFGAFPHHAGRFVVLEQAGKCWLVESVLGGSERRTLLLNLTAEVRMGGATGLLGFAFHPQVTENRKYYLKYQVVEGQQISTLVVERQFTPDFQADAGIPPRLLLKIAGSTQDHNGGCLEFGPDGYLYIGMGDTGPQGDPQGHGQDQGVLLGKILRIDVDRADHERPYGIPKDNPFRDSSSVLPEIWAYGFREPWRFTFDRTTGDLWVGDVGQDRFEEVTMVRKGENHGWNVYEGFSHFSDRYRQQGASYVPPVFSYSHRQGVSITGGYVYRGLRAPQLRGWYVCGDFESRRLWALTQQDRRLVTIRQIGLAPSRIVSFAQDAEGELYFVGYDDGIIYRLELDGVDLTPLEIHTLTPTAETTAVSWRYALERPAEGWWRVDFVDTAWPQAAGGFGTAGTPGAVVRTDWRGSDIWLRREFVLEAGQLGGSPEATFLRIHHDEDTEVYLNGVLAGQYARWTTGYIDVPIARAAATALRPGRNVIALHCHQNSGGQYVDAGLVQYVRPGAAKP